MKTTNKSGIDFIGTLRVRKIINDINDSHMANDMEPIGLFTKEDALILRLMEIYCDWQREASDTDLPDSIIELMIYCRQDFLTCIKRSCSYGMHSYLSIYLNKLAETLFNAKKSLIKVTSEDVIESAETRAKLVPLSEACDIATEHVLEMAEILEGGKEEEVSLEDTF